jgi:hypothetical protein
LENGSRYLLFVLLQSLRILSQAFHSQVKLTRGLVELLACRLISSVVLSSNPPRWTDRIGLYNPTSILWRYFVIFDRRVRCLNWTPCDMAASNAHFWLGQFWDGSEDIITRSRRFCVRPPARSYVDLLSSSAAKTLIVTLQGIQALYEVLGSLSMDSQYYISINLGSVFLPLAILGLLRLPAALWITDDLVYTDKDTMELWTANLIQDINISKHDEISELTKAATSLVVEPQDDVSPVRFRAVNGIHGVTVRIIYLATIMALTGFTAYSTLPSGHRKNYQTATGFTLPLFFDTILLPTIFIFLFYFLRGNSTTTIIPCLTSTWYKLYTALLFLGMLLSILLAAIETRKSSCGSWTTAPNQIPGLPSFEQSYCPQFIANITS